ncbi:hypothetical protein ACI2KT_35435 [Ensifer adhaerens]|uniref:hypothetical protein n=1 Tax=Ensifer adhaerens TaxID=106592 RepID=UPI00384DB4E5
MEDNGTTIAEFLDRDIVVLSSNPLIGVLGLISEQEEIIEVSMDRQRAGALLLALVRFLATPP